MSSFSERFETTTTVLFNLKLRQSALKAASAKQKPDVFNRTHAQLYAEYMDLMKTYISEPKLEPLNSQIVAIFTSPNVKNKVKDLRETLATVEGDQYPEQDALQTRLDQVNAQEQEILSSMGQEINNTSR
jgi:uncharacterized protein YkwD